MLNRRSLSFFISLTRNGINIRPGRLVHSGSHIKPGMRRLIVSDILPGYPQAVDGIVHERIETVFSRLGRCVNSQSIASDCAEHDIFAPIAEQIGLKHWRPFRPIVRQRSVSGEQIDQPAAVIVPFINFGDACGFFPIVVKLTRGEDRRPTKSQNWPKPERHR